jgi:ribosomal protein L7/L12
MAERRDDFPAETITALWQGNKIEAIKILRQAHHLDLKDAKDKVDQYVRNEPALQQKLATAQNENLRGLVRWLLLAIALALIVYYLFVAGSAAS